MLAETSSAICLPSIGHHLVGSKKIQQVLAMPGVLERLELEKYILKTAFSCVYLYGMLTSVQCIVCVCTSGSVHTHGMYVCTVCTSLLCVHQYCVLCVYISTVCASVLCIVCVH